MLLASILRSTIRTGRLTLIDAAGNRHEIGDGSAPGVTIRLHDRRSEWRLAFDPQLGAGECYMDGTLTIEEGTLRDLLIIGMVNYATLATHPLQRPLTLLRRLWIDLIERNSIGRARRNVAHHYDLTGELYELFLDQDRQYSCAYFRDGRDSLEAAQQAKKSLIERKLLLKPGARVLDIGCGWGGLALHLARAGAAEVTGITLSREQHAVASERARAAGLADRVRFELMDYREVRGSFDRIVSVGMFEHVGTRHYGAFFARLHDLLAPDGVALLHSIGRSSGPGVTNPWIRKYIFPGGYSPALSEVLPAAERSGLWVTDVEILRLHYAETLRRWQDRFRANRDRIRALYDERFCRMWEFYLVGSEVAFSHSDHMVFQMQLSRDPRAVPLTRDYLLAGDAQRSQAA
ncbi:MAG: cyclopropane-fatty-acyl-phospholipid synthase family protein [Thalassobaculales bacterium]